MRCAPTSRHSAPVRNMLHPTMGMKKMLVLDTNLKLRLRWNRLKMSCR